MARTARTLLIEFGRKARIEQWWSHKLVPPLAAAYATALHLGRPIGDLGPQLLVLVLFIAGSAAMVSCVNDLFDRADDKRAGKTNRFAGTRTARIMLFLALPAAVIAISLALWRNSPLLLAGAMVLALCFLAYSVPPLRLKARGLAGALADATGANAVPALMAAIVVIGTGDARGHAGWLLAVGIWSLAFGLRGIVWHQLADYEADRASGTATFVLRLGPKASAWFGHAFAFPVEILAMTILVALSAPIAGGIALALYLFHVLLWRRICGRGLTIVVPRPLSFIAMVDFYLVFWPLCLLAASVWLPADTLPVLIAHCALFWRAIWRTLTRIARLRRSAGPGPVPA